MAKQPIIKHKGIVMSLGKKTKGQLDSYRTGRKGFIFHLPFDIFILVLNMVVHGLLRNYFK